MNKLFIALLVVLGVLIVGLVGLHLFLVLSAKPCFPFSLWTWGFEACGLDVENLEEGAYTALVSDGILVLALLLALLPILQMWDNLRKLRRDFEEEHGARPFPIRKPGEDDLEWMLKHYKEGNQITIFAGGFAWLNENDEMKDLVIKLAAEGKLNLVSNKAKHEVEEAFQNEATMQLFKKLKNSFKYESKLGRNVVCTMIECPTFEKKFLYKGKAPGRIDAFNACVVEDTDRHRALLHILSELTDPEHWGKLGEGEVEEA